MIWKLKMAGVLLDEAILKRFDDINPTVWLIDNITDDF